MKLTRTFALSSLVLAIGFPAYGQEELQAEQGVDIKTEQIEEIRIVGVRQDRVSQGATGLTMELNETPQSISVLNAEQIKNFAANNINAALDMATGISVEETETNRTSYTSRGFEIKSTQIDGVGLPNNWGLVTGAMETYGYDEIEVIRGANGQLTGVGNSAGTINYVRKRPTNENEGEVGIQLGSYGLKRLQADYSFLLTDSGSWAARVVAAIEDSESYLDGLEDNRGYISVVVDGQLTDNSTLTLGGSYQDANTDGTMWGGLPFLYSDGTQAEWDVNASPTQNWTMWDTLNTTAFIEYSYLFANDWEVKATFNRQDSDDQSKLLYLYDADGMSFDSATNLGLTSWPGRYDSEFSANLYDITSYGEYNLFGNTHELTIGVSLSESESLSFTNSYDYATTPAYGLAPAFPYALDAIPEPVWGDRTQYAKIDVTLARVFGSTKFNVTDDLFFVAGFNAIDYSRKGYSQGVDIDNEESEISPYLAATYAITDDINAYVSYSDIYQPQEQYDITGDFLDPSKGVNVEIGLKTQWLDDNVLATFALFSSKQENIAAFAGIDENQQYYYAGTSVDSEGFEFELSGRFTENLNATLAYTFLNIDDASGAQTNTWVATDTVNFSLDYNLAVIPEVTVGLGGKWQSETENFGVVQESYIVVNAFARWNITKDLEVQANIDNLTDEKYITSLSNPGYYATPLSGSVSVSYNF